MNRDPLAYLPSHHGHSTLPYLAWVDLLATEGVVVGPHSGQSRMRILGYLVSDAVVEVKTSLLICNLVVCQEFAYARLHLDSLPQAAK